MKTWIVVILHVILAQDDSGTGDPVSAMKADVSEACASLHKQCRKCTSTIGCGYCFWNKMCIATTRNCTDGRPSVGNPAMCTDAFDAWERAASAALLIFVVLMCCFCGCCIACCRALH
eukprot:Protomagalhaensia_wolfi_Nauph_80__5629@NODE_648_length_2164_cov_199_352941_g463_i1_p3_GENE_NODE_648_length_2164_cov_199_352941_g463_i1NODE_648_length_2164_cov_199_352941_g463_i1_p3_ORF_typecomplete_len118_score4_62DAG1/PF05454_11/0_4_NODE_648_length_2164_cov_199_352941_g463_i117442097